MRCSKMQTTNLTPPFKVENNILIIRKLSRNHNFVSHLKIIKEKKQSLASPICPNFVSKGFISSKWLHILGLHNDENWISRWGEWLDKGKKISKMFFNFTPTLSVKSEQEKYSYVFLDALFDLWFDNFIMVKLNWTALLKFSHF